MIGSDGATSLPVQPRSARMDSVLRAERLCEIACRALHISRIPSADGVRTGNDDDMLIDDRRVLNQCVGRLLNRMDQDLVRDVAQLRATTETFITRQLARCEAERDEMLKLMGEVTRG
jgi:hypothetical protein